jgi:hypothetical protein
LAAVAGLCAVLPLGIFKWLVAPNKTSCVLITVKAVILFVCIIKFPELSADLIKDPIVASGNKFIKDAIMLQTILS